MNDIEKYNEHFTKGEAARVDVGSMAVECGILKPSMQWSKGDWVTLGSAQKRRIEKVFEYRNGEWHPMKMIMMQGLPKFLENL